MSDIENSIKTAEEEIDREKEIERLSKLSSIDFDQVRKQEAGRLNIQLKTLDSEVEKRRKAGGDNPDRQGRVIELPEPELWESEVTARSFLMTSFPPYVVSSFFQVVGRKQLRSGPFMPTP